MEKILIDFQPKVSIVIPVYNGQNFLSKAIKSALNQTYQNIEVIIVNDGSNDEEATRNIALSFGNKVKYYEKENGGVSSALNLGIQKMTGQYFSWLSHDDEYYPDKIEKQIEILNKNKQKDIILFTNYVWIDKHSKVMNEFTLPHIKNMIGLKAVSYGYISGCTLLIPIKCFHDVGNFNESLLATQDYDMWFRLARRYSFIFIPVPLVKSRLHTEQTTNTYSKRDIECNN